MRLEVVSNLWGVLAVPGSTSCVGNNKQCAPSLSPEVVFSLIRVHTYTMTIRKGVVVEGKEVQDLMMFSPGLVLFEFVGKKKVCEKGGIRVILCAGNGPS